MGVSKEEQNKTTEPTANPIKNANLCLTTDLRYLPARNASEVGKKFLFLRSPHVKTHKNAAHKPVKSASVNGAATKRNVCILSIPIDAAVHFKEQSTRRGFALAGQSFRGAALRNQR